MALRDHMEPIHAYSSRLSRMGAYEVPADGGLRGDSLSSAERLRPI